MKENKTQIKHKCEACHRTIDFGTELVTVDTAVNGPRGLVPLGDHYEFCSTACAATFLQNSGDVDASDRSVRTIQEDRVFDV